MQPPPSRSTEPAHYVAGLRFTYDGLRSDAARLTLAGELDLVTASRAAVRIRRAQDEVRLLICDLGAVWFVDIAGLRVLLDATANAHRNDGRLIIANAPPIVPRMLRLLHLEHALEAPALRLRAPRATKCASVRSHVNQADPARGRAS